MDKSAEALVRTGQRVQKAIVTHPYRKIGIEHRKLTAVGAPYVTKQRKPLRGLYFIGQIEYLVGIKVYVGIIGLTVSFLPKLVSPIKIITLLLGGHLRILRLI